MKKIFAILMIVFVALFFYSCGSKESSGEKESVKKEEKMESKHVEKEGHEEKGEKEEKKESEENPFVAMQKFAENVKKASEKQQGGKIVVLNEEDYLKILPEVSGWKLAEKPYYSKDKIGAIETSEIKATYMNGDKRVYVQIQDTGSMSSLIAPIKMALSMMIEHEDSNGYEKPFEFKGEKGMLKYDKNSKKGELTFLVKSRYIIDINSNENVDMKTLKKFLENMKLDGLK